MGDCKDQTSKVASAKDKSILGVFSSKRGDARVKELEKQVADLQKELDDSKKARAQATTFADHVEGAWDALGGLIKSKEEDVKNEPSRETYNKGGLALLRAMQGHLGGVMDLCESYQELK